MDTIIGPIKKCRTYCPSGLTCGRPARGRHPDLKQIPVCADHLATLSNLPPMPCITLWQPWASWIAHGWKTIETRQHDRLRCLLGKQIGIHAAERYDYSATDMASRWKPIEELCRTEPHAQYTFGKLVATAYVADFRLVTAEDSKAALYDCSAGNRWGLILEGIEHLRPYKLARGRQGIWYYFT